VAPLWRLQLGRSFRGFARGFKNVAHNHDLQIDISNSMAQIRSEGDGYKGSLVALPSGLVAADSF
jgi:hypothetical protein